MQFKSWDELSVVEQLQNTWSDFYKDVHGFRPRFASTEQWNSEKWLQGQLDSLTVEAKVVFAAEAAAEQQAIVKFEAKVTVTIAAGAKDRATAVRWLMAAENDEYVNNDADYFCYLNNLPYGYFREAA